MNIYKLTSLEELDSYDRYQSLIVVAENEENAKLIHPYGVVELFEDGWFRVSSNGNRSSYGCWASHPRHVAAELIGVADSKYDKPQIICADFVGY